MLILGVDPGTIESAYVIFDGTTVESADIIGNNEMLLLIKYGYYDYGAIEMMRSYGMPIGDTVMKTLVWIGRFQQRMLENGKKALLLYRKDDICMNLCKTTRASDTNIRQALIDRFGPKPTKKNPNKVYGDIKLKADEWQAFAVAVTYFDLYGKETKYGTGRKDA